MLTKLIELSIRQRMVVIFIWALIVALGVHSFQRLPFDAFPDTTPVQVTVNTVAPALSPLEIERQVTQPLERSLTGLPDLKEIRSLTRFGFSQITLIFEDETDIYLARQVVTERLGTAELPPAIDRPALGPIATGLGEVFHYTIDSDRHTLAELRTLQDWTIEPELRSVGGVAEVIAWGGDERQFHVVIDPLELHSRDLSLSEVIEALERNNANASGGVLEQGGESIQVVGIGIVRAISDVENIAIRTENGVPIRIRDVARVVEGREIRRAAVTADGDGEIVLGLGFMMMGENSHEVTTNLKLRLQEIQKSLPDGVKVEVAYDRTDLVDAVLSTVRKNLLEAAALVIAVLFIFLGNLRAGLIVAAAIPLSLLFAFNAMLRFGIAGSLMSLGAIDFGLVVDSSVIMVENASRRLREDPGEQSREEIVREAAIEVRRPTMFGELIIMAVYLPVLFLEGVEGKLFRPMALTVIFALFGSMVLSLTLVPALSSLFLKKEAHKGDGIVMRGLKRVYAPLLRFVLRQRNAVLSVAILMLGGGALLATQLGAEFVPRLREGAIVINTVRLAGVSADESVRYGTQIEKALLERFPDEIDRIWSRTGTPEVATDPMGLELTDVFIMLTPRERWKRASTQDELVLAMQEEMSVYPGMRSAFLQPIEMRVNEMVAGIRADVGVKLYGDDFDMLKKKGREIEAVLKEIPGAADVSVEQITGQPVLKIEIDRDAIARHGVAARDVLEVIDALGTRVVGELTEGERRFPITIRVEDAYRHSPEAVGRILVTSVSGDRVPLSALCDIALTEGPTTIQREWGKRRIVIEANVRGRDVVSFVEEAKRAIDEKVERPAGTFVHFGGQFEHLERAQARLLIVVPIALSLIFMLLYLTYSRVLDAVRVFASVPFAALGGVVLLTVRDLPFSIAAAVGFVAVSGVSVLGDIMLVTTIRQLEEQGYERKQAIELAAERRLRPVLMTALVACLGFVPMALNTGVGAEVQRPLATVVIGGLISSTILTLLVLPTLYYRLRDEKPVTERAQLQGEP